MADKLTEEELEPIKSLIRGSSLNQQERESILREITDRPLDITRDPNYLIATSLFTSELGDNRTSPMPATFIRGEMLDLDGTVVSASLSIDSLGRFMEVDIYRRDEEPLQLWLPAVLTETIYTKRV